MLIGLLLFVLGFTLTAEAINPFPAEVPTFDSYVRETFLSFENYMTQLERSSVITYQKNGCRDYGLYDFKKHQHKNITICLTTKNEDGYLKETITYKVIGFPEARLIVKRKGDKVKPWDADNYFNFVFPLPSSAKEYELNYEYFNTVLWATHSPERSELHVNANRGDWLQHFVETKKNGEIIREYGCPKSECRRYYARAILAFDDYYSTEYFWGDSPTRTLPLEFRRKSFEEIIMGLRIGGNFLKQFLIERHGFPNFDL